MPCRPHATNTPAQQRPRPLNLLSVTQVRGDVPSAQTPGPLLYEWRIYRQDELTCIYIGKARNGGSRPLKTYPAVVEDLHQSRGCKKVGQIPVVCYFRRDPWGYRWIHHELEAAAHRIINEGNPFNERIELSFPLLSVAFADLHSEEARAIQAARTNPATSTVLANGRRSIRVQHKHDPSQLDQVWV